MVNESISWHLGHSYNLKTVSIHVNDHMSPSGHLIETGWENTWRSAAVHWGEGTGNWRVEGSHYINFNEHDRFA